MDILRSEQGASHAMLQGKGILTIADLGMDLRSSYHRITRAETRRRRLACIVDLLLSIRCFLFSASPPAEITVEC